MAEVSDLVPPSASEPGASPEPAQPPSGPPSLRASDAEREAVVERLSAACGEGRLTLEELSTRVDHAYRAVSHADLVPLVADLPDAPGSREAVSPAAVPAAKQKGRWVVAIMGSATRTGHWRLAGRSNVVTVMGEAEIDLRQAVIETPEIELRLWLMMGEQRVIVPEGVEVEVSGLVVMGERRVDVTPVRPRPGVPRLHIKVVGMMGEVRIRTG